MLAANKNLCKLNLTPSYKALIFNFILFILLGVFIWSTNIYGQTFFPSNSFFPFFIRSIISASLLVLAYYLNLKFCEKNELNREILKFKSKSINHYFSGVILGCILIVTMWAILYLIYPFEIIRNHESTIVPFFDIVSYSLGNTLEEFLFRGFILLASVKLCGKIGGILFVSFLFGLFHLPGLGATKEGLSMVMTTFTMSLLFIAVFTTQNLFGQLVHFT